MAWLRCFRLKERRRARTLRKRIRKLKAQNAAVLDRYIGLRLQFALLQPLLDDEQTIERWATGPRARGFGTLRVTLYRACALEAVNLIRDRDPRTASLKNLVDSLEEEEIRDALEVEYTELGPLPKDAALAPVRDLLIADRETRAAELTEEFHERLAQLQRAYSRLAGSGTVSRFKSLRNKSIAHAEVVREEREWSLFDPAALDLRWSDLGPLVDALEEPVQLATSVFRQASFDFEMLTEQHDRVSTGFWGSDGR